MEKKQQPNIIMIMTDQQRYDTIAELGFEHMDTPNMDKLAQNGTNFENAFCPGATCVPSRAAIFTGMHAHNTGVYNLFNSWGHQRTWVNDLADNGYHCVNIGKMHVSPTYEDAGFHERVVVENPQNYLKDKDGRDDEWGRYLSFHNKKRPLDRQLSDPNWGEKVQGAPWHMEEHLHSDVFIGNSALAWINRHEQTKPVFLQIGFTGPHEVYDPLPRHYDKYKDADVPKPITKEGELDEKPPQQYAHQEYFRRANGDAQVDIASATEEDIQHMRRHYYASVTTIDEKLGEIMDALEEQGYLENAIVVFTSDHGDMLGDHQLPFKWLMYDSVVHVPLIVWDTRRKNNQTSKEMTSLIDIGPSLLEEAGVSVPSYFDGHSFMDFVHSKPEHTHREYVLCEDNYLTMIRSKDYKLIYYTDQDDSGELYDLRQDPNELNNLYNDENYSDIQTKLQMELLKLVLNSTYSSSVYKNYGSPKEILWPEDNYYLHPITKTNPNGWYMK